MISHWRIVTPKKNVLPNCIRGSKLQSIGVVSNIQWCTAPKFNNRSRIILGKLTSFASRAPHTCAVPMRLTLFLGSNQMGSCFVSHVPIEASGHAPFTATGATLRNIGIFMSSSNREWAWRHAWKNTKRYDELVGWGELFRQNRFSVTRNNTHLFLAPAQI